MEYSEDDLLGLINGDDPEKENLNQQLDEKLNDIDRVLDVSSFLFSIPITTP